ncbi:Alpha/Beta hydrolase protein [Halenospora varia]|nr:Alpha/Beta hydrolase protein [Halenospora varia]
MDTENSSPNSYAPPHITPPSTGTHKTTLILLHGTSTSGPELAASMLEIAIPARIPTPSTTSSTSAPSQTSTETGMRNLAGALPNTRLVFPTGKLRKTTVFGGRETNAWFDVVNFADRTEGEDLAIPGIFESIRHLTSLIRSETLLFPENERGKGQIIFGGFSQGAAMSMMLFLSNELAAQGVEREVGGWILMSGWLPFARQLHTCIMPFHSSISQRQNQAISWLRSHVGLEEVSGKELELGRCNKEDWKGMFMGHGMEDQKVRLEWAGKAKGLLDGCGVGIRWRVYEGLGHWFVGRELGEVVSTVDGEETEVVG